MENGGYIDEVMGKCSKSTKKKKSTDSIIFSTLSLMKRISNDGDKDLTSQLKNAINEEDLSTIK